MESSFKNSADKFNKYFEGIIHKEEKELQTDEVLVYFKFTYDISTKEAAQLLIKRLSQLVTECDKYNL